MGFQITESVAVVNYFDIDRPYRCISSNSRNKSYVP